MATEWTRGQTTATDSGWRERLRKERIVCERIGTWARSSNNNKPWDEGGLCRTTSVVQQSRGRTHADPRRKGKEEGKKKMLVASLSCTVPCVSICVCKGQPVSGSFLESPCLHSALQLEMTASWEPISAALTRGQNGPANGESIGRADSGGRGRARWVSKGEGDEGFYIAQSSRRADLLAVPGGRGGGGKCKVQIRKF